MYIHIIKNNRIQFAVMRYVRLFQTSGRCEGFENRVKYIMFAYYNRVFSISYSF